MKFFAYGAILHVMHEFVNIVLIAVVGAIAGLVSIPFGFKLTDSPATVYVGNALGSLVPVLLLFYFSNRIIASRFKKKLNQDRLDQAGDFINKHGIKAYGLVCPLFPGVTVSVPAAVLMKLNMRQFKPWLYAGVFIISAGYVFGYYFIVVK